MCRKLILVVTGVFAIGLAGSVMALESSVKPFCKLDKSVLETCDFNHDGEVTLKEGGSYPGDIMAMHKCAKYIRLNSKGNDDLKYLSRDLHGFAAKCAHDRDWIDPYMCAGYRGRLNDEQGKAVTFYDLSGDKSDEYYDLFFSGEVCEDTCKPCYQAYKMIQEYLKTQVPKDENGNYDTSSWQHAHWGGTNHQFFGPPNCEEPTQGVFKGKGCGICTKKGFSPYKFKSDGSMDKVVGIKGFPCANEGNDPPPDDPCAEVTCAACQKCENGDCKDNCPSGKHCNTTTNQCEPEEPGDPCAEVTCATGTHCVNGVCVPFSCVTNDDCPTNYTCRPRGQYSDIGICVIKQGIDPCLTANCQDCERCENGKCMNNCPSGKSCINNQCVSPPACSVTADCLEGHDCYQGKCITECGGCPEGLRCSYLERYEAWECVPGQ